MVEYPQNGVLNKTLHGFDLKNENFTKLSLPSEAFGTVSAYLIVIEGCVGIYRLLQNRDIIVWRMKELEDKKKEWIKMMTISSVSRLRGFYPFHMIPFCWLENGKLLFIDRLH